MAENAKYKEVAKFWEDFEIGEKSSTNARTITEADIVMHAMHSGDWMPHHTDAEWCKTQPFKKPIMHGNGTFSISTGLCIQGEPINPHGMSYGYNKIRYPNNVFAGDTIKVVTEVIDKQDHPKSPDHGLIIEGKTTTNQHGECVCYAEHVIFVEKKKS
ncbi:MaoC/PaaZ C-terminal domain-containing protein [Roseibium sp.]|uniref:MaoC/PaaZ C-terminal domain-containing protein n=1 Tax=Roseibium sp. TaxID=1936156 RepID=UPI003D1122FF